MASGWLLIVHGACYPFLNNSPRSLIPPDWLSLFSGPEVQRLISGDNSPIDLKDLRRNTSYYGGFHDSHRVVSWFLEVMDKDCTDKEKSMFLEFVTICSKHLLLGFENLEPPFSIRLVGSQSVRRSDLYCPADVWRLQMTRMTGTLWALSSEGSLP